MNIDREELWDLLERGEKIGLGWRAVYILWGTDHDRPLYIGKSTSVWERLRAHLKDPVKRAQVKYATILRFDTHTEMSEQERHLIRLHHPLWNVRGVPKQPKNGDQNSTSLISQWAAIYQLAILVRRLAELTDPPIASVADGAQMVIGQIERAMISECTSETAE